MSAGESVGAQFNVSSPTACGNTLNWTDPSCQLIASGALNTALVNGIPDSSAWTVISRHGEYAQSENECNVPGAISVANSSLGITTTASTYTCGNFNANGSINTTPASWPYSTGDVQWNRFNFTYGTIIARLKLPAQNTGTWPAIWMIGSNCQDANKYSGDPGFDGCPTLGSAGYREIDLLECFQGNWCNFNVFNPGQINGLPSTCNTVSDTNYHVLVTSWTAGSITQTLDGSSTCSLSGSGVPNAAMVLIMQIQTQPNPPEGPPVNANLPANMYIDYVKVCDTNLSVAQCSAAANNAPGVIFYDDFTNSSPPAPPTGLGAIVK